VEDEVSTDDGIALGRLVGKRDCRFLIVNGNREGIRLTRPSNHQSSANERHDEKSRNHCGGMDGVAGAARAQMEMPKPGPEHTILDVFPGCMDAGWQHEASPMGPGGKAAEKRQMRVGGGRVLVRSVLGISSWKVTRTSRCRGKWAASRPDGRAGRAAFTWCDGPFRVRLSRAVS